MIHGTIHIDAERCKGCELCPQVCPKHLIHMNLTLLNAKGYHPATLNDPAGQCTGCAVCAIICPEAGITVYRETRQPVHAFAV